MKWPETETLRAITSFMLVLGTAFAVLYDMFALWSGGAEATISRVIYATAQEYPVLTLAVGILMGHLFWPQHIERK